ncbi:MAG: fibronectin type III domain-containing protein [Patescibacteria group bacterium]
MKKILLILGVLVAAYSSLTLIKSALAVDDTTPPSIPTNLAATAVSNSQINLNWTAATDNIGVAGYSIFRNGLGVANVATTTFNDLGLTASTTYTYAIKAYDVAGNKSDFSNPVSTTTLAMPVDLTVPSAPTNLVANTVSSSQINLSWTAATDNIGVAGYKIFRNNIQIATSTDTTFNNTGLTASTTYSFFVKTYDAAGNISTASNTVSAITLANPTDTTIPNAPTNLVAHVVSFQHVNLKWSTSTDDLAVVGYKVFRDGIQIAQVKNPHYNDIRLTASTTYSYFVKAYDAAGNVSPNSSIISVTTLGRNNNQRCQCECKCDDWCEKNRENDRNPIHILKNRLQQKMAKFNGNLKQAMPKQSSGNGKGHNK